MAAKTKKILITTEMRERVVIRNFRNEPRMEFCPACGAESAFIEIDAAAVSITGAGPELIDSIASGRFHSRPAEHGHLLVCMRSITLSNAAG